MAYRNLTPKHFNEIKAAALKICGENGTVADFKRIGNKLIDKYEQNKDQIEVIENQIKALEKELVELRGY